MITDELKKQVATQIVSIINKGRVGIGGNATSPSATGLDVDSGSTPTVTVIKSSENVVEAKVSISGSAITGQVIREVGLLDSSDRLLSRFNFEGIGPFSSSETLEIFILMEVE